MKCPYCGEQMKSGQLRCDSRSGVMWIGDADKVRWFDRAIGRIGQLKATKIGFAYAETPAWYCPDCKKMIVETDLET